MAEPLSVVWITGAGFSKFLGAPLLRELLTKRSLQKVCAVYRHEGFLSSEIQAGWSHVTTLYKRGCGTYWEHAEEFLERLDLAIAYKSQARHLLEIFSVLSISKDDEEGRVAVNEDDLRKVHDHAHRLMAAEVTAFLAEADPKLERWDPYLTWARSLTKKDTVLTFNYDRVPEILLEETGKLDIPHEFHPTQQQDPDGATVLKMHGSVNWRIHEGRIRERDRHVCDVANFDEIAMATPGPRKRRMIQTQPFQAIWSSAQYAVANAGALVIVGYSMPPTDAATKKWLVTALQLWVEKHPNSGLCVHLVLGPDQSTGHARRLRGLLRSISTLFSVMTWHLGAEDFLGLLSRAQLGDYRPELDRD